MILKDDCIFLFRILGPQADLGLGMAILYFSLLIFSIKKPENPIESPNAKLVPKLAMLFVSTFIVSIVSIKVLERIGLVQNQMYILLPHLVLTEAVINLPLPILYILSTPNLSDFVKNWMNDNFLTPVISLINILYHILCTLIGKIRNTPPIYPTIE